MDTLTKERIISRLLIYFSILAKDHPNLESRILQEEMARQIVDLVAEAEAEAEKEVIELVRKRMKKLNPKDITNLREEDLVELGFTRVNITPEESEESYLFHYYFKAFGKETYPLTLVSNTSSEAFNEGWRVELEGYPSLVFNDLYKVMGLTEALKAGGQG